jgi:hypothetical protein
MMKLYHAQTERHSLIILNFIHIAACCISLICIAQIYSDYYISFRPSHVLGASFLLVAFAMVSVLFAFARSSFGYFISFYFYTMIAGYLWLNQFSELNYNHALAAVSAIASIIAFMLPALFLSSPLRRVFVASPASINRVLILILLLGLTTIVVGAYYNFRLIGIADIYTFRKDLGLPTALNYAIGITSNALLPFAFACFVCSKRLWHAAPVLILLLMFYPITLSKMALFAPFWLLAITLLSKIFKFRFVVTLSIFIPLLAGLFLFGLYAEGILSDRYTIAYFGLVNFRMIAIPSLAMDYYNHFFSSHPVTYFCQISFLKPLVPCPYQEQLSDVIYKAFGIGGQFNASLFATEGIASVGVFFAPFTALLAGFVVAFANRLSAGLPPRFILLSSAILPQTLLNVPLTTTLLTYGAGILFLLWYIMPLNFFELERAEQEPTTELTYPNRLINSWLHR